ncbi:hypothetical protein [Nonomuraea sp. NPDC050643]|uniref:hypothetical protein n=1 Tax=Nonomuraea sp. NPDC050643 TaxID=3155660 RepID=UPI0033CA7DA3
MRPGPKSSIATAALALTCLALVFGTTPAATAATCPPEALACQEIRGTPGDYRFWFRFQPAPSPAAFTLTLNGMPASGSLSSNLVGTALEGEFRPTSGLVTGDKVCVRPVGTGQDHCATTP